MAADRLLIDEILESPHLPSLPVVALEVVELAQRADIDVDSLASVLNQDPALASNILKTVNSSFYGQARTITTVNQAIVILGLNTVRALALGFSLVDGLGRGAGSAFDYDAFWQRSLRTAAAARVLARWAPSVDSEEVYLCGLLSRLGVLALSSVLGARYQEVFDTAGGKYRALLDAEQLTLGSNHALVGEQLADRWNLPLGVRAAIRYLSEPDEAPEAHRDLVRVVVTADSVAELFGDEPAGALQRYRRHCDEWFAMTEAEMDLLVGATDEQVRSMSHLLEVSQQEFPSAAAILSRANEALTRINLQVTQESVRLASENVALVSDSLTDPLTGLANRRHLDQFLGEQTRIAHRRGESVGLMMIDLDHFKLINDSHGHPVGDLVLQAVASALRGLMRESDLLSRYGGEEFAVVMPVTNLDQAYIAAERARLVIRDAEVASADGTQLSVTASIGVTALNGERHEESGTAIARADAALYVAKQSGRNQIAVLPLDRAA